MRHNLSFVGISTALTALIATLPTLAHSQQSGRDDSAIKIDEIIITAQKRSESLQDVPIAVTALQSETITEKGIVNLASVQGLIPSVRFQQQGATTEIHMRAVGSNVDLANIEPPVGFHFNGVYIPREGTSSPLFDIERIEALPGPQGTLYGRSSIGGVINVTSKRPTDELSTSLLVEAGNYDLIRTSVVQNVPLNDVLAVRLAADYTYRDGYNRSGADSQDDLAARLSLLYEPNPELSVYVWGYGVRRDGHPAAIVNKGLDANGNVDNDAFLQDDPWDDTYSNSPQYLFFGQPRAEKQDYEHYAIGGELNWDLGSVDLTYIPSYIYLDHNQDYWISALPASIAIRYNQVTQELRLNGETSKIKWLAGLYGYYVSNEGELTVVTPQFSVDRHHLQGAAFFGEIEIDLHSNLRVILGGRFSVDDRDASGLAPDAMGVLSVPFEFSDTFRQFDYRFLVEYDVSQDSMVYTSIQTGYQPGTFNTFPDSAALSNSVQSAQLTAFSLGSKNRFVDGALQVNTEFYFYNYSDLFIQTFNPNANFQQIFNAEKVEIWGNQTDLIFSPTQHDQFNLSVGYLHARNKKFVTPAGEDLAGLELSFSPTWTVNVGYQHDFQMSHGYMRLRGEMRFESGWWGDFRHTIGTYQDANALFDASLTYYSDGEWSVGAWIKNIGDKAVQATSAAGGLPGPAATYLAPPRTFGIRAMASF